MQTFRPNMVILAVLLAVIQLAFMFMPVFKAGEFNNFLLVYLITGNGDGQWEAIEAVIFPTIFMPMGALVWTMKNLAVAPAKKETE